MINNKINIDIPEELELNTTIPQGLKKALIDSEIKSISKKILKELECCDKNNMSDTESTRISKLIEEANQILSYKEGV